MVLVGSLSGHAPFSHRVVCTSCGRFDLKPSTAPAAACCRLRTPFDRRLGFIYHGRKQDSLLKHTGNISFGASSLPAASSTTACSSSEPHQQPAGPDISRLTPELQSLWDQEGNAHLGSIVIRPLSSRQVLWSCPNCPQGYPHSWTATVKQRTRSSGCPFCSGRSVCAHNSLGDQEPDVAKEWDTAKNLKTPHDYQSGSNFRAHWKCERGHEWQAPIFARVTSRSGCPQCMIRHKQPVLTQNAKVMRMWDKQRNEEEGLDPSMLTCGTNQHAHFICHKCPQQQPHHWHTRISDMARNRTWGCPYCDSKQVCKCNSLRTKRPDLAAEWCYSRNQGTPDDYTLHSKAKVWWENKERGIWEGSIFSRSNYLPKRSP